MHFGAHPSEYNKLYMAANLIFADFRLTNSA